MSSEIQRSASLGRGELFAKSMQDLIKKQREQGEPLTRFGLPFDSPAELDESLSELDQEFDRIRTAERTRHIASDFTRAAAPLFEREGDYNG